MMTDPKPQEATQQEAATRRYGVFDTTLERYVGPVRTDKPTKADAESLVPEGHKVAVHELL